MNLEQIKEGILAKFEKCRVVFWQDEDVDFQEQIGKLSDSLLDDGIEVIELDNSSHFEVKYRVELVDTTKSFLLYSNKEVNQPSRDWLFDMRLYAEQFYADSSSMRLNELGMRMEYRQLISGYKKFFDNKQRYGRLQKLLPVNANKDVLELAMIAAVVKADTANFSTIISLLINTYFESEDKANELNAELEKYELDLSFWRFALNEFGYICCGLWNDEERKPSLKDLIVKLLVTDFSHGLASSNVDVAKSQAMQNLSAHLLPTSITFEQQDSLPKEIEALFTGATSKRSAVINFVKSWRENRTLSASYNNLSALVANELEIKEKLSEFTLPENFISVETFELIEQQFIMMLAKDLPAFSPVDIASWISLRLRSHWSYEDKNYQAIYKALRAAKQFYQLKEKYDEGFNFTSARDMYKAYETDIYKFDSSYRVFSENSIALSKSGKDILKGTGLVDDIESLYVDWYLHDLAIAWGSLVDKDNLTSQWKIQGINNQQNFFNKEVKGILNNTQVKRVFVIISDALRYEVAHEIHQQINDEKRFKSEVSSQLGVVPSYTQLGMGSLLPHKSLTAHLKSKVEYKADGLSVHGMQNRHKILTNHRGIAFKADEVLNWTNKEGREKVKEAEVVYIYHDEIDAIGDKAATENQTFEAVRNAVDEIKQLVARIINRLNGSRVLITADHGFIFKMTDVTDSDKTALKVEPTGSIESKKRYVIGSNLPSDNYYWTGKIADTAGLDLDNGDDAEFMVPRGSNRFNFNGGAKFIHGGIMPQEICVPILQIRELHDDKAKAKHAKQKVGVVPLNSPIKIVSNIDRIQFLQTDAIGEKFKPRELDIWIETPEGKTISGVEKVMFDSESNNMDDRKSNVQIKLEGSGFNRSKNYKLVMKDTESLNITSHTVIIDLAFEDDFF